MTQDINAILCFHPQCLPHIHVLERSVLQVGECVTAILNLNSAQHRQCKIIQPQGIAAENQVNKAQM